MTRTTAGDRTTENLALVLVSLAGLLAFAFPFLGSVLPGRACALSALLVSAAGLHHQTPRLLPPAPPGRAHHRFSHIHHADADQVLNPFHVCAQRTRRREQIQ